MTLTIRTALVVALTLGPLAGVSIAEDTPRARYASALARERTLREAEPAPSLTDIRAAAHDYEAIARRFPASGYSDNALWQAANLEMLAFERFGQDVDQRSAVRLLTRLKTEYPASSLVPRVAELLDRPSSSSAAPATVAVPGPPAKPEPPMPQNSSAGASPQTGNAIRDIKRTTLPDGVRVSIQLDAESTFHAERLERPKRVFFDVKGARPVPALLDATLRFSDAVVREIRLGRHPQNTTRIVLDMEGVEGYSVFTLYNPFRIVIDFKAEAAALPALAPASGEATSPPPAAAPPPIPAIPVAAALPDVLGNLKATPSRSAPAPRTPSAVPSANADGQFSLARQLGLGISRIVIDPGHGGHDPGAQANGINESELVLDVAQRLSRLVQKQTAIEVVMTRDSDVFIPLEERTAMANREGADLFLSIHANASRSAQARGIETYFLNFASNPAAEAVAARENSTSGRTMHSLPDIVRAIALNNKLDESRDFADMVQRSMVKRLSSRTRPVRDLGVKQAPFVVLIGAAMPSVLAEISFVTNRQEGQLLKTSAYRQQVAEALLDAVLRYQLSLKKMKVASSTVGSR